MTEAEARRAWLLRAFEQPSVTAPWTTEDGDAATRLALQRLGERAGAAAFTAERARLGTERLAAREPAVDTVLAAGAPLRGLRRALLLLAALAGAAADAVGLSQRINILAPPLFALLVWNLAVYTSLAVAAAWRWLVGRRTGTGGDPQRRSPKVPPGVLSNPPRDASPTALGSVPPEVAPRLQRVAADVARPQVAADLAGPPRAGRPVPLADGPLRRALTQRLAGAARRIGTSAPASSPAAASALARFAAGWWQQTAALHAARLAGVLHAAAAVFALAAIASLYVRGLGFEYRAGWDSTFLTPAAVQRVLSLWFAPALAITGIVLPDAEALARLRFSAGAGENAARWIHLQALTIGLFVVLPRALLALWAGWRGRRLSGDFRLPFDDPYFSRLARLAESADGRALPVPVLPYSFQPPAGALPALSDVLRRLYGGAVDVRLAPSVPLGGEDEAAGWSAALAGAPVAAAVLFTLTATPERETHGAFVAAVAARLAAPGRLHVLVDEAAFRRRFTGADGAARLEQRRDAWRRLLADLGAAPAFFDSTAA